jgi:hypothetical protein
LPTKTGKPRRVPIEPTLAPLLRAMRKAAGGEGRVVTMPPQSQLARVFRRHLELALTVAGVDARDLFAADATRLRIDFRRATRDTGITWRAVRRDELPSIMHGAGHKNVATTMRYVNEADGLFAGFGETFPALPVELIEASEVSATVPANNAALLRGNASKQGVLVGATGFEAVAPPASDDPPSPEKDAGSVATIVPEERTVSDNGRHLDPVETALASALSRATVEGRWDVVSQLAGELQARREARASVVRLDPRRRRSGA